MAHGVSTATAGQVSESVFSRTVGMISTVCGAVAAAMISAGVVITCQMIFVRFALNQSSIWQTEAVTYLIIGATLIGLPYVQKQRGHVNVDLIPSLLPLAARRALAFVVLTTSIAVIGVMAWYGYELFHISLMRGWTSDTVWAIDLWIPYAAMPIGFGLFVLQLVADLVESLTGEPV